MKTLVLRVGEKVLHQGRLFEIDTLLSLSRCLLRSDEIDIKLAANICDLSPLPDLKVSPEDRSENLSHVSPKLLAFARRRLEIILPLLGVRSRKLVEEAARANNLSYWTLNRAIKQYRKCGLLEVLVPRYDLRGAPTQGRLSKEQEDTLDEVIETYHLVLNGPPISETFKQVKQVCLNKNLPAPSLSTVRNRIRAISLRVSTRKRKGKQEAKKLEVYLGTMPGAVRPWMMVQVDHTLVDVTIVDRQTRQDIGRAYITVALDAATRVVVGFYISLDPVCELGVGTCLTNAMLPKEAWLKRIGVPGGWPVWGQPKTLQVDNALEFHSDSLQRGCGKLGIDLQWRRAGHPEDGGRIERFMRTLMSELHILPGSTASNPKERGEYDSVKHAAMTLDELEKYIAEWIVGEYHIRPHRGLDGKTPLQAWEEGLLNHGGLPGLALPVRHVDPDGLLLSFLPGEECTVQADGIHLHGIRYWTEHLKKWRGVKEPGSKTRGKRFLVRLDPRDISRVWFEDPTLKEDIPVPYANVTHPAISLWEWKEVKKSTPQEGHKNANENQRFANRERRQAIPAASIKQTKAVRRAHERGKRNQEGALQMPIAVKSKPAAASPNPPPKASWLTDLKPFDDIEN